MMKKLVVIVIMLVMTGIPSMVTLEDMNVKATSSGGDAEPFIYWAAPEYSFGIQSAAFVNWSYFWQFFNEHASWTLEAYNMSTEEWLGRTEHLDVTGVRSADDSYEKITLRFVAPETAAYRLRYVIDRNVQHYSYEEQDDRYYLDYVVGDNDVYHVFYDFCDMEGISGVINTHGVSEIEGKDMFWFMSSVGIVSEGVNMVLDPIFGNDDTSGFSGGHTCTKQIRGFGNATMGAIGGHADSISAYIKATVTGTSRVKCALYDSDGNLVPYGWTEEKELSNMASPEWVTFNFTLAKKPIVRASTDYHIVVYADNASVKLWASLPSAYYGVWNYTGEYDVFPSYVHFSHNISKRFFIYCSYTMNQNPTWDGSEVPSNGSVVQHLQPKCEVTVTDLDDDSMTVKFYDNITGDESWALRYTESNVGSGDQVIWDKFENAKNLSQTFWWKVEVDDGVNTTSAFYSFETSSIIINFAGNLSDRGGPYWRPPAEVDVLDEAGEGVWRDGYYSNDSRQSEDWIYINCTIDNSSGDLNQSELWVNWLNGSTWTNWTYSLINASNDYYDWNSSGNVTNLAEGYDYSFNIVANYTSGVSRTVWWNKTGINGTIRRRYVQLNCSPVDISYNYSPFYFYDGIFTGENEWSEDRLHHDQGLDGGDYDGGYLNSVVPTEDVSLRYCHSFVGYWFDESVCIKPFTLDNIYYHFWWSSENNQLKEIGWQKRRDELTDTFIENHSTNSTENRSTIIYEHGLEDYNEKYYLHTKLATTTSGDRNFTDNNIYELAINVRMISGAPSVISNRSFPSFILFNVPNNDTLKNLTSDNDGLNDWEELFITYTNPFLDDTDNDTVDDYWENQSGTDPNNWTDSLHINFSNPEPADDATGVSRYTRCNITVSDPFGKHMNLTFSSKPAGGSFSSFGSIKYGSTSRFGYDKTSSAYDSVDEVIRGTWFTCPANGTAQSIKAYCLFSSPGGGNYHYAKAALYNKSDNTLLANTSENAYYGMPQDPYWTTFTFPDPPTLVAGEEYYVLVWGNNTGPLYYTSLTGLNRSISISKTYNDTWPSDLDKENINHVLDKTYDLYVVYTTSSMQNGTYYMDNFDISALGTTYYWKVSANNSICSDTSEVYDFTTET